MAVTGVAELWWKLKVLVQVEMDAAYPFPYPGQTSSPQVLTEYNLPLATGLVSLSLVPCGWLEAYSAALS